MLIDKTKSELRNILLDRLPTWKLEAIDLRKLNKRQLIQLVKKYTDFKIDT